MIALVVYACLVGAPETCAQDVVLWDATASAEDCAALSDASLPLWARGHPNQTIRGHWCVPAREGADTVTDALVGSADAPAACDFSNRAEVSIWARQNPGKSYWQDCPRRIAE